jgi:hypothetical protein
MNFDREDVRAHKTVAALGYVIFFLPLILCGDSRLGRYCANQGLLLLLGRLLLHLILKIFKWALLFGLLYDLAIWLVDAAVLIASLYMTWQLYRHDRVTKVPFIGHWVIIK